MDVISPTNEIAVLTALREAAAHSLSLFTTTMEEDNALLAACDSSNPAPSVGSTAYEMKRDSNLRNCVVVRRGEKQVLHWYIDLADRCIPLLKLSYGSLGRHACYHEVAKGLTPADEYILNVVFPIVKRFY